MHGDPGRLEISCIGVLISFSFTPLCIVCISYVGVITGIVEKNLLLFTLICMLVLLFIGVVEKYGLIGSHVWLPVAMEGSAGRI